MATASNICCLVIVIFNFDNHIQNTEKWNQVISALKVLLRVEMYINVVSHLDCLGRFGAFV